MIFRRRFEMDLEEIRPEFSILKAAAQELRTSGRLKKLLGVYLLSDAVSHRLT